MQKQVTADLPPSMERDENGAPGSDKKTGICHDAAAKRINDPMAPTLSTELLLPAFGVRTGFCWDPLN